MKYIGLVLAGFRYKPVRSFLTAASLIVAFILFGLLDPVAKLFDGGSEQASANRLVVGPRHSITDMLPVNYVEQVSRVAGVDKAAHQTWFGGVYKDPSVSASFTRWAVSAASFVDLSPELVLSEEQRNAFIETRSSAIVGRETADLLGLRVGDKIPIMADIWHNRDGSLWEFDLVGIYDGENEKVDTSRMFLNYDYFDEYRVIGKGIISNVIVQTLDPKKNAIVAMSIDSLFENSNMETNTVSEREYLLNQIKQFGNVGLIIRAVMGAVFFTILLLTANTMSQAVRERIPELAVLKTLGFQDKQVMLMILAEALLLTVIAAAIGLSLSGLILNYGGNIISSVGKISLGVDSVAVGLLIAACLGLVVGLPPALKTMRINIVDALQHV